MRETGTTDHERDRTILWAVGSTVGIWLPLLALNAGFPSVVQVIRTPEIRNAVGYSIALCLLIVIAIGAVGGVLTRVAGRRLGGMALSAPSGFCVAAVGSATLAIITAIFVIRGPGVTLAGDVEGFALGLAGSVLIGVAVTTGVRFLSVRATRGWPLFVVGIASVSIWAVIVRMLIRGTAAIDEPFTPALVASGVSIAAVGAAFVTWKRFAAIAVGTILVAAGALPAMRLVPAAPNLAPAGTASRSGSPNVVVVLIDTWRFDSTDFAREKLGTTPRLDALAENGSTVFLNATAAAPSTIPSVKALITGHLSSYFGLAGWGKFPPPKNAWTLARAFRRAGYSTSAFIANDLVSSGGFESGYGTYWCVGVFANVQRSFFLQVLLARRDYWRAEKLADRLHVSKTDGDAIVDRLADWLDRRPSGPFFTYVHLMEPHWPYVAHGYGFVPPELGHLERPYSCFELLRVPVGDPANAAYRHTAAMQEMIDRYREEVRDADRLIGRIADSLSTRHLLDDTLIVFVSDHGEEFFEHDGYGHGQDVYQELVHVPLVVKWPREKPFDSFPKEVATSVSLLDVFPTLTDLLQLPAPRAPFEGRSLVSDMGEKPTPEDIVSETLFHGNARMAYRLGNLKARFEFDLRSLPSRAARVSLFDLQQDPGERRPIADAASLHGPFLDRARVVLDEKWKTARRATAPGANLPHGGKDEALERLRALGYLR